MRHRFTETGTLEVLDGNGRGCPYLVAKESQRNDRRRSC